MKARERQQLYSKYVRAGVRDVRFDDVDTCGWSAASWVSKQLDEQFDLFNTVRDDGEFLANLRNAWSETFGYVPKIPARRFHEEALREEEAPE